MFIAVAAVVARDRRSASRCSRSCATAGGAATTAARRRSTATTASRPRGPCIPLLTVGVLFGLTVVVLNGFERRRSGRPPPSSCDVTGVPLGLAVRVPGQGVVVEGVREPGPEPIVPVGENVHVTLTGNDVVHAFFVPQFLFKQDAIPGRENVVRVHGRRARHATAASAPSSAACTTPACRSPIVAVPRAEYEAWLAAAPRRRSASP